MRKIGVAPACFRAIPSPDACTSLQDYELTRAVDSAVCQPQDKVKREQTMGAQGTDSETFLLSLASSAMIHLGEVPDPDTGRREPNPTRAQHNIDLLCMLREKTTGNLTDAEESLFNRVLSDLQVRYVDCCKRSQ